MRRETIEADDVAQRLGDITKHLKANRHRRDAPLFKVGDLVYVDTRNLRTERPANNLDAKYAGPWEVTRVITGSKAIEVQLPPELATEGLYNVVHPSLLRLYVPNPIPLQAPAELKPVKMLPNENTGQLEDYWSVDEVVDRQRKNQHWQYRVKWAGDPKYYWEDYAEWIDHYDAWLFHWKYSNKPKPLGQKIPSGWASKQEDLEDLEGYIQ
jgi:hypothetical protein